MFPNVYGVLCLRKLSYNVVLRQTDPLHRSQQQGKTHHTSVKFFPVQRTMGRVKRYKKVKAMDPFAKHSTGAKKGFGSRKSDDLDRNLPPDVKNHEAQRLNNLHGG